MPAPVSRRAVGAARQTTGPGDSVPNGVAETALETTGRWSGSDCMDDVAWYIRVITEEQAELALTRAATIMQATTSWRRFEGPRGTGHVREPEQEAGSARRAVR